MNTGLANLVYSLDHGTYGWWDAGYELAGGEGPRADSISTTAMDRARATAEAVADQAGVVELDSSGLEKWQQEASRHSLYLLDVRWEHEYQEGHVPGAVCAPGGQLIECSEDWIGVRNGRILLLDNDGARARMTASWLKQLGYPKVAVLSPETELAMTESGIEAAPAAADDPYYPEPETELERMQGKKRYMDWQATLPDELQSDGLVSMQLLRF
jgi:rhodanese-related sulfurtransferase